MLKIIFRGSTVAKPVGALFATLFISLLVYLMFADGQEGNYPMLALVLIPGVMLYILGTLSIGAISVVLRLKKMPTEANALEVCGAATIALVTLGMTMTALACMADRPEASNDLRTLGWGTLLFFLLALSALAAGAQGKTQVETTSRPRGFGVRWAFLFLHFLPAPVLYFSLPIGFWIAGLAAYAGLAVAVLYDFQLKARVASKKQPPAEAQAETSTQDAPPTQAVQAS